MDDAPLTRRRTLQAGAVLLASGLAGCGSTGDGNDSSEPVDEKTPTGTGDLETTTTREATRATPDDLATRAVRVASGFESPVGVEIPRPTRRFVVDQPGRVYLQDRNGLHEEPYLDVSDRVVDGGNEQGLLGLAFHPAFEENGRFYLRYSAPSRAGTPSNYSHTFVLSEFRADPDGRTADPDSERTVLEIPEPQSNHNAGAIVFGPDGYLYVAVGDGGAANDTGTGHVDDWYDGVAGGNGQDVTENLLGSVLRLDVDGREGAKGYAVPDDNPLVGDEGLDEHYAWGFRNPWRMSFGPAGRLFVADVGQRRREEVSVVERGGNYGWNVYEGTACFDAEGCPDAAPSGRPLRPPIIEYPHDGAEVSGVSVIGGYRYHGAAMPSLRGRYVFADWRANGRLFAATPVESGLWNLSAVSVESEREFGPNVLSFGQNPAGELFVCTSGDGGAVFRLESTGREG